MTQPHSNRTVIPMPARTPGTPVPVVEPIRQAFAVRLLRLAFQVGGRISPRLTGRWANYLWFRPQRFTPPAREQALLASASTEQKQLLKQNRSDDARQNRELHEIGGTVFGVRKLLSDPPHWSYNGR